MTAPGIAVPRRRWLARRRGDEPFQAGSIIWLLPAGALLAVLFFTPIVYAVYLAFTNQQLLGPFSTSYHFVGFANLTRLVQDHIFWQSTILTLIFVVGSGIIGQTVFGMALALAMQQAFRGLRLSVGAVVIAAWILPEVTAAFVWFAFGTSGGTLGHLIGKPSSDFLTSTPMLIISAANVWRNAAFAMLVFSAGLRGVPSEVLDASELEGASYWRRLFRVTLPILRPTIITTILLLTLSNLSDFTLIYAMTQGGPGTASTTLPVYSYLVAFQFNELSYGSAISVALILLGILLSLIYVRQLKPEFSK